MSYKFIVEVQKLLCSFAASYWKEPLILKHKQTAHLGAPLQYYCI